jgi:hypothetical protein
MSKQTAVEWVVDKLSLLNLDIHLHPEKYNVDEAIREKNKILQQAKAMEKEQMIKFAFDFYYKHSKKMGVPFNLISENRINAEQYYNENYGGDK